MASTANAFTVGDYVVYPKHGVGRVVELQKEEIAGMQLELYVLRFEKERMTLRVGRLGRSAAVLATRSVRRSSCCDSARAAVNTRSTSAGVKAMLSQKASTEVARPARATRSVFVPMAK